MMNPSSLATLTHQSKQMTYINIANKTKYQRDTLKCTQQSRKYMYINKNKPKIFIKVIIIPPFWMCSFPITVCSSFLYFKENKLEVLTKQFKYISNENQYMTSRISFLEWNKQENKKHHIKKNYRKTSPAPLTLKKFHTSPHLFFFSFFGK
jgi:hypothetical protein